MDNKFLEKPINLYLSAEHDCSYLPGRQANSLFVDPDREMSASIYAELIQHGFRRSGGYVYTPYCRKCHDCIPVRLNVQKFTLSRSQKRCKNRNKYVTGEAKPAVYDTRQYQMYANYVISRHPSGGMDDPDDNKYMDFLTSKWCDTTFFELQENNQLIAVAVTDIVEDGFSAVYTFFDTSAEMQKRSLGVFTILWQIEETKRRGLTWLYLGYWIKDCNKMNYKDHYQPLEYYYNHHWHELPPG